MGIISLSSIEPGMMLAKPVYSHLGALLLKEGKELTRKDILLLEAWGITEVDIEGVEAAESPEQAIAKKLSEEEIATLDEELNKKFANLPENEIITELKKVARKIKIEEKIQTKHQ